MKYFLTVVAVLLISVNSIAQIQLKYKENKTVTYDEAIEAYAYLDKQYEEAKLFEEGKTDIGKPLHLFVISKDKDFNPESIRKNNKRIILINNGIHPGEPCGVDGSILFAKTILSDKKYSKMLDDVVICIIPVYNIGGWLNRSEYWRPQQPGPEECGFRGNAKNLDLNRDFIKADTKNAKAITTIFHEWQPDVFLDTHTTNGSDHAYVITLVTNNKDQYDADLGEFSKNEFEQSLFNLMKKTEYEMIPYINWVHSNPENGIIEHVTNGNFSSGYGSLFNTISFMTENHVYKLFEDRVESVYQFELCLLKTVYEFSDEIAEKRREAIQKTKQKENFVLTMTVDSTKFDSFEFTGYKYIAKKNKVTGLMWKEYDHDSVYTKTIPFYRYFEEDIVVKKPAYYIIPQAWEEAIERMKLNTVQISRLTKDTILNVEVYYIENNQKSERQYNGHIANENFEVNSTDQSIQYYKGDYVVKTNQVTNNYIVQVLELQSEISFFRWNFFDPILERREYLTYNGFEDEAIEWLNENPELKADLEQRKKGDEQFANNHYMQMWFIFQNSPYYEKTHNRYPVTRLLENIDLPLCED